jgi:hypothetical protein
MDGPAVFIQQWTLGCFHSWAAVNDAAIPWVRLSHLLHFCWEVDCGDPTCCMLRIRYPICHSGCFVVRPPGGTRDSQFLHILASSPHSLVLVAALQWVWSGLLL